MTSRLVRVWALWLLGSSFAAAGCAASSDESGVAPDAATSDVAGEVASDSSTDASPLSDTAVAPTDATFDAGSPKDGGGGGGKDAGAAKDAAVDAAAFGACTKTTASVKDCKACCDCNPGLVCADQKACRDACTALGDAALAMNPSPLPVSAPSSLGPGGDYSTCTASATEQACKDCCDCSTKLLCGDHGYCRSACTATLGDAGVDGGKEAGAKDTGVADAATSG